MARPRKNRPPRVTEWQANQAAVTIRTGRLKVDPTGAAKALHDHDRLDADELADVVRWCDENPPHGLDRDALVAELQARAVLVAYVGQRIEQEQRRHQRSLLRLLEDGHVAWRGHRIWAGQYVGPLGLTAQNAWTTRDTLSRRFSQADDGRPVPADAARWLTAHRDEVAEVGELLVDQAPDVLHTVADVDARTRLREAIEDVGEALAPLPDITFAELVFTALRRWWDADPAETADPILRDLASRGRTLHASYTDLEASGR
ncbi:hypothetical protein [Saccharothrix hoggarensis]|uniref:Golgi phosphoprotein 3 GPP34 n=1 Tax=Saccharothrix hoggarensis TaxID=913853 RepID=A0ABW3QFT8_9PSEU